MRFLCYYYYVLIFFNIVFSHQNHAEQTSVLDKKFPKQQLFDLHQHQEETLHEWGALWTNYGKILTNIFHAYHSNISMEEQLVLDYFTHNALYQTKHIVQQQKVLQQQQQALLQSLETSQIQTNLNDDAMTMLPAPSLQSSYMTEQQRQFIRPFPLNKALLLPVSGNVLATTPYKFSHLNDSKVMIIEALHTKKLTHIVSPYDGVIVYAKDFKQQGKVVIIEHKDQFYSTIVGFENISVVSGQMVFAGEILGSITKSTPADVSQKDYILIYLQQGNHYINPIVYYKIQP